LQNVIDMSQIIADLRREGWTVTEQDLSFLSPYVTPGVKRFGEYALDLDRELEPPIQQMLSRCKSRSREAAAESGELVKEA
jgi:hypothetical protein